MPYVIKTNKGYIKRTSNFGQVHGNIVLTPDRDEAFRFTRRHDAVSRASVAENRTKEGDDSGHWYRGRGKDYGKFGPLTTEIEEL